MEVIKEYKFYAAHRNQMIEGKCRSLHGHRYGIKCYFSVSARPTKTGISILFQDFDDLLEPLFKSTYDHSLLIDNTDPLLPYLNSYMAEHGDVMRTVRMDCPTSVENVGRKIFKEILGLGLPLVRLDVKETDSSTVTITASAL